MSNAGQAGSAVVGGIIGFFVTGGNPMGAIYGAQIGLLAGTALFPTQLPQSFGPRIEDLATTQAQLGGPVPITYGTIAVPGTVIFLACVEERSHTDTVGGKGAPEQSVTTYTYYQTIALGLCEGPIAGVLRIWENGELRYDVRPQQSDETLAAYNERIEASSEYSATFTVYLGDEAQEADPTIELTMGVGAVPAFRGLAYIVFPNRQLRDDQARRHPQFRFEVFRGTPVTEVIPPTEIVGPINNHLLPFLLPDWPNNRYYSIDLTGTTGLRVFDLLTNTELAQKSFTDIFLPTETVSSFNAATVGPDGALYMNWFVSGSSVRVIRIDPDTLESTSSILIGSAAPVWWERACVVRHIGTLQTTDYIFSQSLFDAFALQRANPVGLPIVTQSYTNSEALVTAGNRVGTTTYAYGLTWSPALSGTGPDIDIYRLTISEEIGGVGLPVPIQALSLIATIPLSALDPACARLTNLTGLVFDATDNTLIFGARGRDVGGSEVVSGFYKYDPSTDDIAWRSAELDIDIYDDMSHESRLRGSTYAVTQVFDTVALIDTRTGSHEIRDFTSELPNSFDGQSVYDSARGALITFVIGAGPWVIFIDRLTPGAVSVASIVSDICQRSGFSEAEIDVTGLEDREISGYAVTRPSPGRGIIDPLREVAYFDVVESDGLLKFPTRGGPIVATFTDDDLGAHYAGEEAPPLVTTTKMQDVELPRRLRLQYIAETRDYDSGDAPSPVRVTSAAVNEVDIQVPVSITDDQAMQAAEVLWADAWGSRWAHEIALDVAYLALDPTDVIGVPVDGRVYRARIASIDDAAGFLRKLSLVRDDDGRYTSVAAADPPQRPRVTLIVYSATALILLDLPPLRDSDNDAGIYAVAYPQTPERQWGGAVIHRSIDGGATYSQIGSITSAGTVGQLAEALPAGISTTWDDENTIVVDLIAGALESRTESAVIGGANAAAIGAHGRWEIVQFLNAAQISDTRWQLSGLLRGRRATEHNIGGSFAGDLFVMLSTGSLVRLPLQTSEIGAARIYRAVTLGTSVAEGTGQAFTATGEALRPFSPVHIHGEYSGGDLIVSWTRRGRLGQELRSGADIPLSEETEAYEVDILVPGFSPETVLRTLESTEPTVTYTAADQAIDGFATGDPIMVRVYQLSAVVGRGTPGEVML
jgi:hypothetical protein